MNSAEIDFLPADYVDRKTGRRTTMTCTLLLGVLVAGVVMAIKSSKAALRRTEVEHRAVDREYTLASSRIQRLRMLRGNQPDLEQQASLGASLLDHLPKSILLAEVTNALPAGVSLIDLTLTCNQPGPTTAPATASAKLSCICFTGLAHTEVEVEQYLASLGRSPLFSDVNLLMNDDDVHGTETLRRFQVSLTIEPTAQPAQATAWRNSSVSVALEER